MDISRGLARRPRLRLGGCGRALGAWRSAEQRLRLLGASPAPLASAPWRINPPRTSLPPSVLRACALEDFGVPCLGWRGTPTVAASATDQPIGTQGKSCNLSKLVLTWSRLLKIVTENWPQKSRHARHEPLWSLITGINKVSIVLGVNDYK
jgi:hypothetical protein